MQPRGDGSGIWFDRDVDHYRNDGFSRERCKRNTGCFGCIFECVECVPTFYWSPFDPWLRASGKSHTRVNKCLQHDETMEKNPTTLFVALPPGNSHRPPIEAWSGRFCSRIAPLSLVNAAATTNNVVGFFSIISSC